MQQRGRRVGDKGQVYQRGWDGEYRPAEGLLGPKEGEARTGLLSGEPVPSRDLLGNQRTAADGSPLYERADRGGAEAAGEAGGVAILAVLALLAVAGAAVATRFWASLRRDVRERSLSLPTVGYGSVILWLASWVGGLALGPRSLGGAAALDWAVSDVAFTVACFFGLLFGPARLGEAMRARRGGAAPDGLWRWVALTAAEVGFTLFMWGQAAAYPAWEQAVLYGTVLALGLGEAGAFAWGWSGRPNLGARSARALAGWASSAAGEVAARSTARRPEVRWSAAEASPPAADGPPDPAAPPD